MELNEVFENVKGLFVEDLGIDESKVTMEAKLEEDLEIDSLGIIEVVICLLYTSPSPRDQRGSRE